MLNAFETWLSITPPPLILGLIAVPIGLLLVQIFIDEWL